MQLAIDYATAAGRHPALAAGIVAALAAKLAKAGLPAVDPEAIAWSYTWSVRLGGLPLHSCFVGLQGAAGRRVDGAPLSTPGQPTPRHEVPAEIVAIYARPKLLVDAGTVPHVASFSALDINGKPGTELVTGGYRSLKKGAKPNLFCLRVGAEMSRPGDTGMILQIDGTVATWGGGLHRKAAEAYRATPEGGTFTYRSQPFLRLTAAEIRALVAGSTFKITF